ncbi:membrane protein [Agaricicola taiwanensis]|uniref:Membrane protein n=1 Tax=Agaricicola taiwanensis TaxID=591372 RepID=A0A8J2YKB9_9RHOB|nr:membrane-bound PQQ-dependent dehydrogenase, glucose/quinate/shikimate family [Agaricicola taiwanensis]GGE50712.1 membrane protein [Agaricicola taiwanensis]
MRVNIWLILLGLVFLAFGAPILLGGIYLIVLGGSWYYALAGAGLVITAWFLFRGERTALWTYGLTFLFTLVWALWEAGFNAWAQVPRLVAPTVMLVLVLITAPALRGGGRSHKGFAAAAVALLLAGGAVALQKAEFSGSALAQQGGTAPAPSPSPDTDSSLTPLAPPETPVAPVPVSDPMPDVGADWPAYGGTHHATRYSPLSRITKENVGSLERVWQFRTGDMPNGDEQFSNQNTPLKIGNRLFVCSALGKIIALDAATGRQVWTYDPEVSREAIPYNATCRGLAYYESPTLPQGELCARRIIGATLDARLIAVDLSNGQPCPGFGVKGEVDLTEGIGETAPGFYSVTSPVTVVRNIAVVGAQVLDGQRRDAPSGVVRGYNAETGVMEWAWDMGRPGETEAPTDGETYTRGTPNMWTIASGDNELGHVYLPMGNSAVDYWGETRSEAEQRYSTAIVALDVTTGQPVWHYQTVRYDVWDYDLGSQGTLIDFPTPSGPVPALILPTKLGQFFIFDRRNGNLLVSVEDRAAPRGGVEPERLSPTQPFVTDFPTLLKPDLEEKNMWGMTPLDQLYCRIQFRQASYEGIFTAPTTDRHWVQYPGYNGGSDWGGVAIDEGRGIMIANYNDMPNHNRLIPREVIEQMDIRPVDEPRDEAEHTHPRIDPQAGTPYGVDVNAGWRVPLTGLLCKEPPYGGITAIDLKTHEVLWDRPFGTARKNGPFGIPSMLPFTIGTPNNGGAVVTSSGLVFIAAATDDLIRAIDIETGEVLWEDALPAGGQANPMTYEANGRQYVVIAAGGHSFMETPIGDFVLAYALPE